MAGSGYLIVGLGNPGRKYELTRHNVGFLAVDYFADQHKYSLRSTKWQAEFCRERLAGQSVLLVKPQTYMNKSGQSVARFADFYKILPENICVIHDDLDLPAGRIKVVAKGGAGGHNGIRSVISQLGTAEFTRLKIGIGRPPRNDKGDGIPVDKYVLSTLTREDIAVLNERLPLVGEALELFIQEGVSSCMNSINGR